MKKTVRGFSILEVLISAGIFTIVILGISQTVLLMHRYTRGNICKMQAHLCATSYFEQLLYHTHPLELNGTTGSINLLDLKDPTKTHAFKFNVQSTNDEHINSIEIPLIEEEDIITVYIKVQVLESPIYTDYGTKKRQEINPPEGFQSLHMTYWWTSPFATNTQQTPTNTEENNNITFLESLPKSELYAIRPILPDEADYEG